MSTSNCADGTIFIAVKYLFYYIACLQLNVAFSYEFICMIDIRIFGYSWGASAPTWKMLSLACAHVSDIGAKQIAWLLFWSYFRFILSLFQVPTIISDGLESMLLLQLWTERIFIGSHVYW